MLNFLIPLVLGFSFNLLSAFTTAFSKRWGERNGTFMTVTLRAVLGIPLWMTGFCLAVLTPSPQLYMPTLLTRIIGVSCFSAGCLAVGSAFMTMRSKALLPSTRDALVESGLYAYLRHPMDAGTMLSFMGLLLLRPTQTVLLACLVGIVWASLQAWIEERDLLRRLPSYRDYMARVPRFVPRLR